MNRAHSRLLFAAAVLLSGCPDKSKDQAEIERQLVHVGVDESIVATGLPDYLRTAFEHTSELRMRFHPGRASELVRMAGKGEVDAVLVAGDQAFADLDNAGLLERRRVIGHEELVLVGPYEDTSKSHGAKSPVEFIKNIGRLNAAYLKAGRGSLEELAHKEIMKQVQDMEPGSFIQSKQSGLAFFKEVNATEHAFALVLRSTILLGALEGMRPRRVYQDGRPELVVRLRAAEIRPARTGRPRRDELVQFLTSDEVVSMVGSFGRGRFGSAIYGAGDVEEGEGAKGPE